MKEVNLAQPAFIKDLLRYPIENPITVSDDDAQRLKDAGSLAEDAEDLEKKKLPELQQLASDEGVDLNGATKKDDIIAAIRAHRAAPAE